MTQRAPKKLRPSRSFVSPRRTAARGAMSDAESALAKALAEANAATAAARAATAAAEAATARAEQLIREHGMSQPPSSPLRARSSLDMGEMRPTTSEKISRARALPRRIFVVRHGESEGNVDETLYSRVADPEIRLTARGVSQAEAAGRAIRARCEADGKSYRVFFYFSPYMRTKQARPAEAGCALLRRSCTRCSTLTVLAAFPCPAPSRQTCAAVMSQFDTLRVSGVREEPQLREQVR